MAHVYVTLPVLVAGEEQAADAADAALPRWPVVVTLADGCPAEAAVIVSKTWEVNSVTGPTERRTGPERGLPVAGGGMNARRQARPAGLRAARGPVADPSR